MKKWVWLNLKTGEFSNTFNINSLADVEKFIKDADEINKQYYENWKLIEYTCLNDKEFEFSDLMKLR